MISLSPSPAAASPTPLRRSTRRPILATKLTTPPSSNQNPPRHAVVVGAGLAGLAAAARLHSAGVPVLLLESSSAVGGRVRTDSCDGFLLDRGFQIFITAYPEAQKLLDYSSLNLQKFYSGALIYTGDGQFHRVSDPFRHPTDGIASLFNPIGTIPDKFLIGISRLRAQISDDREIFSSQETSILSRLRNSGFTSSVIDKFFRPFFGGIFFDRELETSSRLFDFIFKCLALGDNVLPAGGISAIPEQIASGLPPGSVRLLTKADGVDPATSDGGPVVRIAGGDAITADLGVVVAVELPEARRLVPGAPPLKKRISVDRPARSTTCLYFSADRAPLKDPILLLNGTNKGIVNNMFFATNVAPTYAPAGKTLVSVSLIGCFSEKDDEFLVKEVVKELGEWFGSSEVGKWKHLRTYRIPFAQPDQSPPTKFNDKDLRAGDGVYLCGDYMSSATFDGALVSGRLAAEALIQDQFPSGTVPQL